MTAIESLITKARRYCMQNYSFWSNKYQNEMSGSNHPYSNHDYNLFPRYNVLDAILQGLLRVVDKKFDSLEACKKHLKKIGAESQNIFTIQKNEGTSLLGKGYQHFHINDKNLIEKKAIQEEREKFINFIEEQSLDTLINVEPLPYEKILSEKESEAIRGKLQEKWNFDGGYWEPLEDKSHCPTLFLMKQNISSLEKNKIENTIKEHIQSKTFFAVNETLIDYETDIELLNLDLYETIICDDTFEWVVYGSHESTLAFGGNFLLKKINELYKDKKEKLNKWE